MEKRPETSDTPLVVIAGAGNMGRGQQEWASWLFPPVKFLEELWVDMTETFHQKLGELSARSTIVATPDLGLDDPDKMYRKLRPEIDGRIKNFDSDQKVNLIGHSYGGFMAMRYAHERPEMVDSVASIAGPFSTVRNLPHFYTDERLAVTSQIAQKRANSDPEDVPKALMLASQRDLIVPPESALPDLPDVRKVLFTDNIREAFALDAEAAEMTLPPGHIDLLKHWRVRDLCGELIKKTQEDEALDIAELPVPGYTPPPFPVAA